MDRRSALGTTLAAVALLLLASCDIIDDVIGGEAQISVSASSLDLGAVLQGDAATATFAVQNTGDADGAATVTSNAAWLSASPSSATVPEGGSVTVSVTGECTTAVGDGRATGTLAVESDGQSFPISVTITCSEQPLSPPSPDPLAIAAAVGETASGSFSFSNLGSSAVTFTVTDAVDWLAYSPSTTTVAAGSTQTIVVTSECTAESTDAAVVTIDYPGGPRTLTVERTCGLEAVTVAPMTSFLGAEAGTAGSATVTLTNGNATVVTFDLTNLPSWMSASPASGTIDASSSTTVALSTACPAGGRTVRQGTFDLATSAGTVTLDAFQVCAAPPTHDYDVDIRFFGEGFDLTTIHVFLDAAEKWESVITDDLDDIAGVSTPEGDCSAPGFPSEPALVDETIDDLLIYAGVAFIDGEFNVVGTAGPCLVRQSTSSTPKLPVYGTAFFDSADTARLAADGRLGTVVLHEMGHVLGLGTLWGTGWFDLIEFSGDSTDCRSVSAFSSGPDYVGSAGIAAYDGLSTSSEQAVPLEDEGGPGTKCGHWDEDHFDTELMTGYIDGADDPLSEITGESLLDMGYATDVNAYEAFAMPGCAPACSNAIEPQAAQLHEILLYPKFEVSPQGLMTPLDPYGSPHAPH